MTKTTENELTPAQKAAAEKKAAAEAKKAEAQKKKDEAAAKKAADAKAKADAKAAKAAETAAAKAAKPASVSQNGVTRPNKGATLKIWEICDDLSKETKKPAVRKDVTERALAAGLELGTTHTQYGRWRKFHGLSSVRSLPAEEKA